MKKNNVNQEEMASLDKTMEIHGLKRKNKKGLIIGLVIILIVILGGLGWYLFFGSTSKAVYEKAIKDTFADIIDGLNIAKKHLVNYDFSTDSVNQKGEFKISTNQDSLKALSNYTYTYEVGIDAKNEKGELALGINKNDAVLLDGKMYIIGNEGYLESSKLFDGIMYLSGNVDVDYDIMPAYNIDTYIKTVKKVEESLLNFVKKSVIKNGKAELNINGQVKQVKDHIFTINNEDAKVLLNDLVDNFLNDDEFLKELARITFNDYDSLKSSLEELKNTTDILGDNNLVIHLYTEGITNDIVGFNVLVSDKEVINGVLNGDELVITLPDYPNFELKLKAKEINLSYNDDGKSLEVKITEILENKDSINLKYIEGNNNFEINMEMEANKLTETSMELKIFGDIKVNYDSQEYSFNIDWTNTVDVGTKEIADIDTTNAKDISTLTEDEGMEIINNFYNILKNEKDLYDLIENAASYFIVTPTTGVSNISF